MERGTSDSAVWSATAEDFSQGQGRLEPSAIVLSSTHGRANYIQNKHVIARLHKTERDVPCN